VTQPTFICANTSPLKVAVSSRRLAGQASQCSVPVNLLEATPTELKNWLLTHNDSISSAILEKSSLPKLGGIS